MYEGTFPLHGAAESEKDMGASHFPPKGNFRNFPQVLQTLISGAAAENGMMEQDLVPPNRRRRSQKMLREREKWEKIILCETAAVGPAFLPEPKSERKRRERSGGKNCCRCTHAECVSPPLFF